MQGTPAQIYDQFNRSLPLEIGHDRRLTGLAATRTTTPIPPLNNYQYVVPEPIMQPSLDSVVTKSMLPYPQSQQLVTTQVQGPTVAPEPVVEKTVPKPKVETDYSAINEKLFELLTTNGPGISCPGDRCSIYKSTKPQEGTFNWQFDEELLCRSKAGNPFVATKECEIGYTRWGPVKTSTRLLLLHDALDSRKSWWCVQKSTSPFVDTIAVDLLGSGDSSKPRGLNRPVKGGDVAEQFPWSFEIHAMYLLSMARFFWPEDKFYIVGLGWGAQIAAVMASLAPNDVAGLIMINPPGFGKNIHPETAYADISQFATIQSEKQMMESQVSFIGRVRSVMIENFNSGGCRGSCNHAPLINGLNPILEQYSDLDRRMVLVEQLQAFGNGSTFELPRTSENVDGLEVEKIVSPVCILASEGDLVYGAEHRNLYPVVYYNAVVNVNHVMRGGHFLNLENPDCVSEVILNFIRSQSEFSSLSDAFVGFEGFSGLDTTRLVMGLRDMYEL